MNGKEPKKLPNFPIFLQRQERPDQFSGSNIVFASKTFYLSDVTSTQKNLSVERKTFFSKQIKNHPC